jgi:hypothetical protein
LIRVKAANLIRASLTIRSVPEQEDEMRIVTLMAALALAALLMNATNASAQGYTTRYVSGSGAYAASSDAWMDRASRSYGGGGY